MVRQREILPCNGTNWELGQFSLHSGNWAWIVARFSTEFCVAKTYEDWVWSGQNVRHDKLILQTSWSRKAGLQQTLDDLWCLMCVETQSCLTALLEVIPKYARRPESSRGRKRCQWCFSFWPTGHKSHKSQKSPSWKLDDENGNL